MDDGVRAPKAHCGNSRKQTALRRPVTWTIKRCRRWAFRGKAVTGAAKVESPAPGGSFARRIAARNQLRPAHDRDSPNHRRQASLLSAIAFKRMLRHSKSVGRR